MNWTSLIIAAVQMPFWALFWTVVGGYARRHDVRWLWPWRNRQSFFREFSNTWILGAAATCIVFAIQRHWDAVTGSAISLAVALSVRWWRKNRTRVKGLIGAKSRAIRDAMAARMPKPRTVPQGA